MIANLHRNTSRVALTGTLLACVIFLLLQGYPQTAYAASISKLPTAQITVTTFVSPHYTIFSPSTQDTVLGNVLLSNLNTTNSLQIRLLTSFRPFAISATATLSNGINFTITPQVIPGTSGTLFAAYFTLPTSTENVSISVRGTQTGESLLWRQVTNIPRISVSGIPVLQQYDARLYVPKSSMIWEAFNASTASKAGTPVPIPSTVVSGAPKGYVGYELASNVATIVYQSKLFIPAGIVVISLSALTLIIVALGMFSSGKKILESFLFKIRRLLQQIVARIRHIIPKSVSSPVKGSFSRRFLFKRKSVSSYLLILFILCGILMIGIATMGGPNPSVQAYVISDPSVTHQIHQSLDLALGNTQIITPSQDYSDFGVMSSVGQFNVLVVSNYPSIALPQIEPFILQGTQNVPVIVIDKSADPTFAGLLRSLYPSHILTVNNASSLQANESQILHSLVVQSRVQNTLGLGITSREFTDIIVLEGGLSFLLVFLGWAYLGARIAEPNADQTLTRIALTIAAGVFVFYFSEVIYVATSATLEFPLSLHAVLSGAQSITAVGEFGHAIHLPFGGGSTPRLLSGVLGVFFGSLFFVRGTTTIFEKRSFALIIVVVALLLANPFSLGSFVFQGLLLFIGNIPLGAAYASALTFKGFLYGIGAGLGGEASPTFLMSAGKIAYFAGLVPLAFIRRMGRTTASLTLLFAGFLVGDGGVRVGEMTPDKTAIGVLPGIVAGFAFAVVLLLISALERYITSSYVKSKS